LGEGGRLGEVQGNREGSRGDVSRENRIGFKRKYSWVGVDSRENRAGLVRIQEKIELGC
jgi:hypothetical protein